ncbi:Elongation factor P--(R)-beta-lysine ligase [Stieleria neptunia]|uniref:Elongation factor P--(R)-beta-lysine ligase n=1 Tax=Stieleria neptunia TaxID=2527979 RepID=A0A518HPY5_9BACT|nr:EF-P lysine aminoacylase EpmA [Stieleria neptunia]QDV42904.1 Elongation factor P--(R)-beta-lysine ligase [Stieleria neptunia]
MPQGITGVVMANVNHLAARAELLRQTRRFFDQHGFLETQPPCLSRDCVVDAYLDPLAIETNTLGISDPRLPERFYLQTSPESAMKRMLAGGAPSIYSIGPVFRGGEAGQLHNIEFTMLEWYEVGGDFESAMRLTGQFACEMLGTDGYDSIRYRDAFAEQLGFDPIDVATDDLFDTVAGLDAILAATIADDRDQMLDYLLSAQIAPSLGQRRPLLLTDYPLPQAALAKPSSHDDQCAARFELYVRGVEVANGYDELLDAEVLSARYAENNRKRIASGRPRLATETTLLDAMREGLPPCSGVAMGVDRLLMLRVGADRLEDVMPFGIWNA